VAEYNKRVKVHWELLAISVSVSYIRINPKLHHSFEASNVDSRMMLNMLTDQIFVSYVMIVGADPHHIGESIDELEKDHGVGNNNYPKTLQDARHYCLEKRSDYNKKKKHTEGSDRDEKRVSLASTAIICHACGKKGHVITECYTRDKIPKEEWYIERMKKKGSSGPNTDERVDDENGGKTSFACASAWYK
jgi:hypothetical protein